MPVAMGCVKCLSVSDCTTLCELGGGRGGKGGGDRLCMDRDLREGSGGGASPPPLLLLEAWCGDDACWFVGEDTFVTNGQSCKTHNKSR